MALPRLTGALRSFSNVTKQENYNEEVADLKVNVLHENYYRHRLWEIFGIVLLNFMYLKPRLYLVLRPRRK